MNCFITHTHTYTLAYMCVFKFMCAVVCIYRFFVSVYCPFHGTFNENEHVRPVWGNQTPMKDMPPFVEEKYINEKQTTTAHNNKLSNSVDVRRFAGDGVRGLAKAKGWT